jgi:hypothetical protein
VEADRMIGESYPLSHRIPRAVLVLVVNLVFWIIVPIAIGGLLSKESTSTALSTPSFVYTFGAVITALQVLAALTKGMAVSVPFNTGTYLAEAYYVWAATNGGNLAISAGGLAVTFGFAPIVYLLMLPLLFNAIRFPVTFLLEQSEVARPFSDQL